MSDDFVFNPESGRVGRIQLVVRWVLCSGSEPWPRRHALFSYESEQDAINHAALLLACRPEQVPEDLTHAAFWSYPQNNYPAHRISTL